MIAEYHINKLKEVEPLMFRAGESSGIDKTFMTRTYVPGLIARMALMEGGYQTLSLIHIYVTIPDVLLEVRPSGGKWHFLQAG